MATKWYFRAAANSLSGTFPTDEQNPVSYMVKDFSATGATTLRTLSATKGSSQTSLAATSTATTAGQSGFYGFWCSPALDAQTITGLDQGQVIDIVVANAESNLAMNFGNWLPYVYVWRPSTGAKVGELLNVQFGGGLEPSSASSEQVATCQWTGVGGSNLTIQAGDVIIVEMWARLFQAMNTSYTGTLYYDGTTENATENAVVSNHAGYIQFSQTLALQPSGHTLTGNSAKTQPTSTNGVVSSTHTATGNSAKTQPTSTNGQVTRTQTLTGNSSRTDHTSTSGAISQTQTLTGNSTRTDHTSTNGAVTMTHTLTGNSVRSDTTSTTGAISLGVPLLRVEQAGIRTVSQGNAQLRVEQAGVRTVSQADAKLRLEQAGIRVVSTVSEVSALVGNSSRTDHTSTNGAVAQTHVLGGNSVRQDTTCKTYIVIAPTKYDPASTGPAGNYTLTNDDTRFTKTTADGWRHAGGKYEKTLGRWYFEVVVVDAGTDMGIMVGIAPNGWNVNNEAGDGGMLGYFATGQKRKDGTFSNYGASFTTGDVIGVALDLAASPQTLTFYKNGTSQGVAFSGTTDLPADTQWKPVVSAYYIGSSTDIRQHTNTTGALPPGHQHWKENPDAHVATGSSSLETTTASSGAISSSTNLTGNSSRTDHTSSAGAVSSTHLLAGNNVRENPTGTSAALGQTHLLAGNSVRQDATSTSGAVVPSTNLTGNGVRQDTTSSNGGTSQTHKLTGAPVRENITSASAALSQTHVLAGNSTRTNHTSTTGAATQTKTLTGSSAQSQPTCTNGNVVSIHKLTGNSAKTQPTSTNGSVGSAHSLTGNSSKQPNISPSGNVVSIHLLAGNGAKVRHSCASAGVYFEQSLPNIERQGFVDQEARREAVGFESRQVAVPAERRAVVGFESRQVAVQAEH